MVLIINPKRNGRPRKEKEERCFDLQNRQNIKTAGSIKKESIRTNSVMPRINPAKKPRPFLFFSTDRPNKQIEERIKT